MKYQGKTRSFRFRNPIGSLDKYRWITLKSGDIIPEELIPILEKEKEIEKQKQRIKDFESDLADDNKRNFSHDESKKSPGRPSKESKKKGR